ncbi:MAG: GNAT family N-acetyltransferase [Planctomycetota bacterium]|nr:MAG: GNAT family N-acetyltransferase [Planctomycetota bacterium]
MSRAEAFHLRCLQKNCKEEIEWVAQRMRRTLMEVVGEQEGVEMYSMDWLRQRVHFHLEEERCTGQVILAEDAAGFPAGHLILRLEKSPKGEFFGLISTIYVEPKFRRQGLAGRFYDRAEAWFRQQGMEQAVTDTADDNTPLLRILQDRGFRIVETADSMVRLAKSLNPATA